MTDTEVYEPLPMAPPPSAQRSRERRLKKFFPTLVRWNEVTAHNLTEVTDILDHLENVGIVHTTVADDGAKGFVVRWR